MIAVDNNSALLNSATASKMLQKLINSGYNMQQLARRLQISTSAVKAMCDCKADTINDLNELHARLIDLFCQTKWE